jgi:hypothetical protein
MADSSLRALPGVHADRFRAGTASQLGASLNREKVEEVR